MCHSFRHIPHAAATAVMDSCNAFVPFPARARVLAPRGQAAGAAALFVARSFPLSLIRTTLY